jgi:hypothetical protein
VSKTATARERAGSLLRGALHRVRRRRLAQDIVRGVTAGLLGSLIMFIGLWWSRGYADAWLWRATAVLAVVGITAGVLVAVRGSSRRAAVAVLERGAPRSRNTIFTAAELIDVPPLNPDNEIRSAVIAEGEALLASVDVRRVVPLRRNFVEMAAVVVVWITVAALAAAQPTALPELLATGREAAPLIVAVEVDVIPPPWIGGSPTRSVDAERVDAATGSRITVTVRAAAASVRLERAAGTQEMSSTGARTFSTEFSVDGDDFMALEPVSADGRAGERRLVSVRARADASPQVRITAPARDLVLPHVDSAITVDIEAIDDHAVAGLYLRYTIVTGFGEQFTFTDGEVPLQIIRRGADRWQARAHWPLRSLGLDRGDMVVYRAVATDRRPGGAPAESDTYMIEIGDANVAAAGGFSTDEDPDRYALSQQMIIVLTERLLARRAAMTAGEFAAEAQVLAAAQRRIRAEYVFMLGGELGGEHDEGEHDMAELHEEAHARADLDVLEGRVSSQGRQELVRAIQSMSHAARLLHDGDVGAALRAEQTALIFLQRAFSRSRYILRALSERERIDLERRLTGSLAGVSTQRRPRRDEALDSATVALRAALSDMAGLVAAGASPDAAAQATKLARALRASAALSHSEAARAAAARLADAANAFSAGRADDGRSAVLEAMQQLTDELRTRLRSSAGAEPAALRQLEGALFDALRRGR